MMARILGIRLTLTIFWIGILGAAAVRAQDSAERGDEWREVREILSARKASFEFTEAPLDVVAGFVGGTAGIDLRVDPDLSDSLAEEGLFLTVRWMEVSLWNVLQVLLEFTGARLARKGDAVLLTRNPHAFASRKEAVYDLGKIVRPSRREPGRVLDLVEGIRGRRAFEPVWEEEEDLADPEFVEMMIQERVDPDSWAEEGIVSALSGIRLRVVHTEEVHERIRKLLRRLERFREPEISFRVRVFRVPCGAFPGVPGGSPVGRAEEERLSKAGSRFTQPFGEYRLSLRNGERVNLFSGKTFSFVTGREAEEAREAEAREGALIDLQALSSGPGHVPCLVRVSLSERHPSPSGLPRLSFLRMESAVPLRAGETRLVSFGTAPFGDEGKHRGDLCTVVLLSAQPGPWPGMAEASPVPDPETAAIRSRLDEVKPSVDYLETPLAEAVRDLADRCGVNILIHPDVALEQNPEELLVNLQVEGIPLAQLLDLLCRFKNLTYRVRWGIVLIDTEEGEQAPRPAQREFPVLDLLGGLPVSRTDGLARGLHHLLDPPAEFDEEENRIFPEILLQLVRDQVSPDSWDIPPHTLDCRMGRLIAANASGVLDRTGALLDDLRRRIWGPVTAEGMFFSIPPDLLEGNGLEDPVLLPEKCGALEAAVTSGKGTVLARFGVEGSTGSVFRVSGGRQIAYIREGDPAGEHGVDTVVEGWRISGRASAGTGASLLLNVNAYCSVRRPPGKSDGLPGALETLRFETDLPLARGTGTLVGGGADPARPGARIYLYLRLR
jgi:hypothetical protein